MEDIRKSMLGSLPLSALSAKRTRSVIKRWRLEVGEKQGPRAADVRVGLVSKALNWAIDEGLVDTNPTKGIESLHCADRSDVTFTTDDLERFETAARKRYQRNLPKNSKAEKDKLADDRPPAIVLALKLVCYGGFRREDLCNLAWRDVGANSINYQPLKSFRRARTARKPKKAPRAVIPIKRELRDVLRQCDPGEGRRGPWVLTSSRGTKFTPSGLTSSFIKVRDDANILDEHGRKKRLHDGRGTFITHMRANGEPIDRIADMVGWSTAEVERIAKTYIDTDRVAQARADELDKNSSST